MKNSKQVYLCVAFLFIFLSSFSANVYSSLSSAIKNVCHHPRIKEIQPDIPAAAAENLLFEETETANDSEQFLSSCFILLPASPAILSEFNHLQGTAKQSSAITLARSIFISIRILRI